MPLRRQMKPVLDLLSDFFQGERMEQEADTVAPTDDKSGPRMSGNMSAFKPQWKNRGMFAEAINKRLLGLEGGEKWRDVPFTVIRGGVSVRLPNGQEVPLGIPFPRAMPGIFETIYMCGHEQAMALAWSFAAHVASAGGEVEVRAEEYTLRYEIKTELFKGNDASDGDKHA